MSGKCVDSDYFSGQGALMLGERDPLTGKLIGPLRPVGNCSSLIVRTATETLDHRENCSGKRALDLQITRQIDVTVEIVMESFDRENLALALNGESMRVAAGSVSGELVKGYVGGWTPLEHMNLSNVVVSAAGVPVTDETEITIDAGAGHISIPVGSTLIDGTDLSIAYDYAAYDDIEALTQSSRPIRVAHFVGLNTASVAGESPVVVEFKKLQIGPLAEMALINEELASMTISSAALADAKAAKDKSAFFRVRKLPRAA